MFWSIAYKGSLIQGAVLAPSSERIVVQFTKHWPKYTVHPVPSLHAAKCLITRLNRTCTAAHMEESERDRWRRMNPGTPGSKRPSSRKVNNS